MTVDSARRHYAGRGAEWKGRTDKLRCCRDRWSKLDDPRKVST
jgi:hypothetical protein